MGKNIQVTPVGGLIEVEMPDGRYTARSYLCSLTQLANINGLFTDATFLNDSKLLFGKPSEYVLSIRYYPLKFDELLNIVDPLTRLADISFGGKQYANYKALPLNRTEYTPTYKATTLKIDPYYNNFADYMTRVRIFIPYIAYRDLNVNELMGKYINVYLTFDLFNGIMTSYIVKYDTLADASSNTNGVLIDEASGQLGIDIPFGSTNANDIAKNIYTSIIDMSLGGVKMIAGGQAGDSKTFQQGLSGFYGGAKNIFNQQERFTGGQMAKGSYANLHAPTSIFLIYERPNLVAVNSTWVHENGYPLEETVLLSSLTGYTEVSSINFDPSGYDIYSDEITEIISLLQDGVIL